MVVDARTAELRFVAGRVGSQVVVPFRGDGLEARDLRVAGDLGQIVPVPLDLTRPETIRRAVRTAARTRTRS